MADFTGEEVKDIVSKLEGADLSGLDLSGADLFRARLIDAELSRANLSGAKYDNDTKWPEGFDPVAAGAVFVDEILFVD